MEDNEQLTFHDFEYVGFPNEKQSMLGMEMKTTNLIMRSPKRSPMNTSPHKLANKVVHHSPIGAKKGKNFI
jgi:hypothetical protein